MPNRPNNKIFSSQTLKSDSITEKVTKTGNLSPTFNESKLLPTDAEIIEDLNTYKNFGIFKSWTDVMKETYNATDKTLTEVKMGTPGVRSIFNKSSVVLTGADQSIELKGTQNQKEAIKKLVLKSSEWRVSNNVPLIDSPENRKQMRKQNGCSVKELVSASKAGMFGRAVYSYADFMYCSHLGLVPNNYLITLRRYPVPVNDSMMPVGVGKSRLTTDQGRANVVSPISTMVTWLGVSGNELSSILKYSYNMPFTEINAKWEEMSAEGGQNGILNGIEAAINPTTRRLQVNGTSVPALDGYIDKFFHLPSGPYSYKGDWRDTGGTKVYGPIDRVKSIYQRSEEGLKHTMSFDLTFEYELKAYNGINPRQAMLDLLANIFSTTYTTGGFWKGGYRGGGIRQSSVFSNLSIFKQHGTFTGFMDAFSQDVRTHGKQVYQSFGGGDLINTIKQIANAIGGMLIGGLLNKLGRPARYTANALLSDTPVGLWHITIGNPWHPIMTLGNMILKNTEITHSGPLGLDDFPSKLTVKCTFDRGKPKDQVLLESIYMGGNDRIYHSMSRKVLDMYEASYEYKYANSEGTQELEKESKSAEENMSLPINDNDPNTNGLNQKVDIISPSKIKKGIQYLQEVFGDYDAKAVLWASREQAEGAFEKNKYDEQEAEERRQAALKKAKSGKNR